MRTTFRRIEYELFTLKCMILQVPKEWKFDPNWDGESTQPQEPSYLQKFHSKWRTTTPQQDPVNTMRIIDHFVIEQKEKPDSELSNG
uniref:Hydrolase/ protein serine/threonine phosphatase n=1 Tax=Solanum tuberosum TaxID=4113 RepID=M1D7D3_SOLTU